MPMVRRERWTRRFNRTLSWGLIREAEARFRVGDEIEQTIADEADLLHRASALRAG
jgi:hypothetical protein